MLFKTHRVSLLCLVIFFTDEARAVTLTSGQTNYITTSDITSTAIAISSSLSGTSSSYNKIKNTFTITTNTNSGAYGIRTSGSYNQITNDTNASINTSASSGRGISIASNSQVYNLGSITTQGTTSYGIYAGSGNNTISNSGSIITSNTSSYGIYLASDNNTATNSGSIATQVYGIYSDANNNKIYNSGTITTTISSSAHGIFMSAGSSSTASSSNYGIIDNSGTINATGNGIYNKDNYSQISNFGSITTGATSSIYGIRNEGENVTITNTGTISSTNYAIYNSDAATIINNSGTISGGIQIGSGTLNILGGTISGAVNSSTNAGNVVVGNSVSFDQNAAFSSLNSLTISSNAILNSAAAIGASNIYLSDNATLNLNEGSSLSGVIQGLSDSQGSVNISAATIFVSTGIASLNNSLANLNVLSSSAATVNGDIYADQISLAGTLNFDQSNNSIITENVVGQGTATLNIGSQNQKITGDLTLNSGDTLKVALKNGATGSLIVSQTATIDQDTKIAINTADNQSYIANNTSYQIISANNLVSTTSIAADNISVNNSDSNVSGLLRFTVDNVDNALVLKVNHLAASEVSSNVNAQNIYQNLVDIGSVSSGKLLAFQQYLDSSSLSTTEVTQTINQLAPQSAKAMIFSANNAANSATQILQNRLEKKRQDDEKNEGLWTQIFGAAATQKAVASDDGYKNSLAGIAIGADREISDDTTIGASAAMAKSAAKTLDSAKQNIIDTYQISIYGSKNFDHYFVDAIGAVSLNHFDSSRAITAANSQAISSYLGQNYLFKLKAGCHKKLGNGFGFSPEIGVNFLRNDIAGYTEKGADELNLKVSQVAANFLEARVGSVLSYNTKIHELPEIRKVSAAVKFSYGYSLINDAVQTKASFQDQSTSFKTQITKVDRVSLKVGTEVAFYQKDDATFLVDYDFERKSTYSSQAISLKIRQEF